MHQSINVASVVVKEVLDLRVYRKAFHQADRLFWMSRDWPVEERYALTSQIRRSSRAVCANLSEAWRKRRYPAHFISKLSDADAEAAETRTWLRFAHSCSYLGREAFESQDSVYDQICGGLVRMMSEPDKWCGPG
ncbi:four helix bundle protein [Longibacter salinarum]|uniref:Four helix bundle protein n=1 Tax=Longibacter salinarum TaxID=1850348 RepID=A0A2A8CXC0_9BACT|nr:four helix bundle protein [Longibacter salinarum]